MQVEFISSGSVIITERDEKFIVAVEGLQPATTYHVYAIGQDNSDPPNRMQKARKVVSRTLDNLPPQFLLIDVTDIGGTTALLVAQINEPSNVSYAIFEGIGQLCPSADKV